ncbi:mPR-like GPCR protein [Whalleya microplaca]|nr:mPR-like GPCR protein [Whalleya microplaca]
MASLPPAESHTDRKWSVTPPSSPSPSSEEKRQPRIDSSETSQDDQQQQHRRKHQREPKGEEPRHGPARLLSYDEIPSWYQDNPYIRHGYRPVTHSTRACLRSWARLHNETVNIFTHLVPATVLLLGLVYVLTHLHYRYDGGLAPADYAIVACLLLAGAACLGVSSAYHTLLCHSREVEARWLRLDFVGIVVLILGSFVSGIYVAFWCEGVVRTIYWSMIGSLAAISVVVVLAPAFQGPRWRTLRLLTFVCTGLSGLAPIVHGICLFGFARMMRQSGLPYYLAEGGLFLLGAVVYATRFPESMSPGTFDIYGSSHQIFHVLVVLATVVHLIGVLDAFDYNYHHRQCI